MDDLDLIKRAKTGDRESFAALVHSHQAKLRAFTARYVESSDDAYDLVQDAFLNAYQNLNTFDTTRDFEHWLRGICRNLIRNYYRSRSVRRKAAQSLVDAALVDRLEMPDEPQRESTEQIQALRNCLAEIGGAHSQLLKLRYSADETLRAIAQRMGRSESAIAMLLLRLRSTLRTCVERRIGAGGS